MVRSSLIGRLRRRPRGASDRIERRLVWIFGSPRTGSTWLTNLLRVSPDVIAIDEPSYGLHVAAPVAWFLDMPRGAVDPLRPRLGDVRADSRDYMFSRRYERIWGPALRELVLARLAAQAGDVSGWRAIDDPTLILKETHGSIGADVLMPLLPGSKLIFLARDGRDVVDSELHAMRKGSWGQRIAAGFGYGDFELDAEGTGYLADRAHAWVWRTLAVQRAYRGHPAERRRMLRYEDLNDNPEEVLGGLLQWLGLAVPDGSVAEHVERLRFDRLKPNDDEGSFFRAAKPGGWRENLSGEQREAVEAIMGPTLRDLGYE